MKKQSKKIKDSNDVSQNANLPQIIKKNNKIVTIEKYDERDNEKITFTNIVFVFIICAMIGWLVETVFVFLSFGKITNRGMTYGPYCSIYGYGGLILYLFFHNIKPTKTNIPFTFISTALTMGAFELVSGLILKHILGIEMWNYDKEFLPILHYTSIPVMIGWGILATTYVFFVQPLLLKIISFIPKNITKRLALIILVIYVLDLGFSTVNIYVNPEVLFNLVNPDLL